ncbi:MAG: NUDIX domain-containing protein [Candidatus Roizmanbacteria bacterium]
MINNIKITIKDPSKEMFDVLDENGKPTGQIKSRTDVHHDGNWHKSIFICIINSKNEILIQKRSKNKDFNPNMWDISVAGHVSTGDTSIESAIRELHEELGIVENESSLEFLFMIKKLDTRNRNGIRDNEFCDMYLCRYNFDISDIILQKEEVSEVNSILLTEFEKNILVQKEGYLIHSFYPQLFEVLHQKFF